MWNVKKKTFSFAHLANLPTNAIANPSLKVAAESREGENN